MTAKKWVISLISITAAVVFLFGAMEFILDPLLQYGGERGPLTYRKYSNRYSNPGIAKHYDYNAVLLGSSMIENTDVSELDALFGCKTVKLPYSAGNSFNHKTILDVCYRSGKRLDHVFWSIDEPALITDKDTPAYPLPMYLYDDDKLNDLSYLLNLDIFYIYTIMDVYNSLRRQNGPMMKDGSWIEDESLYCRANALVHANYPTEQQASKGETYYQKKLTDNLRYNILPFLDAHPETEFHFFMVPYSISYWYIKKQAGLLEAEIYNVRAAVGEILKYKNVKVHFFQNELDVITNLDLYKDTAHFKPEINRWMSQEMTKDRYLLTADTYNRTLDDFYRLLTDFDYDGFYAEQLRRR